MRPGVPGNESPKVWYEQTVALAAAARNPGGPLSRRQSPERVADLLAAAIAILEQKPGFPDTTRLRTFALNAKKLE